MSERITTTTWKRPRAAKQRIEVYSLGLVSCSVCAPADMPVREVGRWLNENYPTGIESRWRLSRDRRFRGGQPHPCACEQDASRIHRLFHC